MNKNTYQWAMAQLNKGILVERKAWPWRHYLAMSSDSNEIYDCYFNGTECVKSDRYNPTVEDIEADDWRICSDERKK